VEPSYVLNRGWPLLLADLGIAASAVLGRAGLAAGLFDQVDVALSTREYFSLWSALAEVAEDDALAVRIAGAISFEGFDPLVFAAMCSADFSAAIRRIRTFKELISPIQIRLEPRADRAVLSIR